MKTQRMIQNLKQWSGFILLVIFLPMTACDQTTNALSLNGDSTEQTTSELTYPIVGTNQTIFYSNTVEISVQTKGDNFYGQNANFPGNVPSYHENGDGTITDLVTGLMWQKSPDTNGDGIINYADKLSYNEAVAAPDTLQFAGYTDWRLPTVKELYSLIEFSGLDPSGYTGTSTEGLVPFIDTGYFDFAYGDESAGERIIDAQFATSTVYRSTTMEGNATMFGVNFADGRIKGYPKDVLPGHSEAKRFYVLYLRGNQDYGINDFQDNGDGTITDKATGLMWMQDDSGEGMTWQEALTYAEETTFAGYSDWRLPNSKELQSIVDYSRCPDATNSAAIDPLFHCTSITNEAGQTDYPYYWSSTTHASNSVVPGGYAAYVSFGRAMGYFMNQWLDVHGAGAQRSDPKTGNPDDYPYGHGPQGDAIRINNFVRLVRTIQ